jgi:DNA-binding MarR family transcriptional regulator
MTATEIRETWRQEMADTTAECALANLRRAARAVTRMFDEALAPSGLRSTQFTLLATVAAAGIVNVTELAEQLGMDRTTLARNLGPLERDGLLQIATGTDQRVRLVSLSEAGQQKLRNAVPLRAAVQERVVNTVGDDTYRRFLGTLDHVAGTPERHLP